MQTPLIPPDKLPEFQQFWEAYPRKVAKLDAEKAFREVIRETSLPELLNALSQQKQSVEWTKEQGRFAPYAASYLRSRRWRDTLTPTTNTSAKPELSPVQLQIHSKEYERILEAMKSIKASYDEHREMSSKDRELFNQLKARRNQLRVMLNILR